METNMETKVKKKIGRKPRMDKAMEANILIRTSKDERSQWYEKSKSMGYKSFADCVRAMMEAA